MDCSLPASSGHGILQGRILEWVAIPFSRGSSWSRDQTQISCIVGRFFTIWTTREVPRHALEQNLKYTILGVPWQSLDSVCVFVCVCVCAESECPVCVCVCVLSQNALDSAFSLPLCVCVCVCVCVHTSAHKLSRDQLFVTLWSVLARLPCLWDFPTKNTGEGCHFFLQGIFPT